MPPMGSWSTSMKIQSPASVRNTSSSAQGYDSKSSSTASGTALVISGASHSSCLPSGLMNTASGSGSRGRLRATVTAPERLLSATSSPAASMLMRKVLPTGSCTLRECWNSTNSVAPNMSFPRSLAATSSSLWRRVALYACTSDVPRLVTRALTVNGSPGLACTGASISVTARSVSAISSMRMLSMSTQL